MRKSTSREHRRQLPKILSLCSGPGDLLLSSTMRSRKAVTFTNHEDTACDQPRAAPTVRIGAFVRGRAPAARAVEASRRAWASLLHADRPPRSGWLQHILSSIVALRFPLFSSSTGITTLMYVGHPHVHVAFTESRAMWSIAENVPVETKSPAIRSRHSPPGASFGLSGHCVLCCASAIEDGVIGVYPPALRRERFETWGPRPVPTVKAPGLRPKSRFHWPRHSFVT